MVYFHGEGLYKIINQSWDLRFKLKRKLLTGAKKNSQTVEKKYLNKW